MPLCPALLLACLLITPAQAQPDDTPAGPASWLTLPAVDQRGRRPFRPDAVFARYLLAMGSPAPQAGETVTGETGEEAAWAVSPVEESGDAGRGAGWAYAAIDVPEDCVMMVKVQGAAAFFVNGDGFAGDVYRYGWPGVPVALKAGPNDLYVTGIRGAFRCTLSEPDAELMIDPFDRTAPHLIIGSTQVGPLGLTLVNATRHELRTVVTLVGDDLFDAVEIPGPVLQPLEVTKVALPQPMLDGASVPSGVEEFVRLATVSALGVADGRSRVSLGVREDGPVRQETYLSSIDGSAQPYAVLPPSKEAVQDPAGSDDQAPDQSLVLSLHGAGANAMGQAGSYSRRPDFWVVAPTNRRPFGFDWQDWGRADAYEVRELALALSGVDPRRVALTGHSMGGHGAWHLAANDTDGFSAVAPSAGWCSFDTYGGRPAGTLAPLWHAADAPSLTLDYVNGLIQVPTFVLHGSADTSVPVSEAEAMIAALTAAGGTPRSHIQDGAGHWWNGDAALGVDCVDHPDLFQLFRDHPAVEVSNPLDWVSAGPGVDNRHHELLVEQVLKPGQPFRIQAQLDSPQDPTEGTPVLRIQTENVRLLGFETSARLAGATLEVDGQAFPLRLRASGAPAWLERDAQDRWELGGRLTGSEKRANRMGPFKKAFDRGFVFVIGTAGTDEEDAQLLARARHDAQVWWYRGNGSAPLLTDQEFLAGTPAPGNVIVYGNATTNSAWDQLIDQATCPLRVTRGHLSLGGQSWEGQDLGAVFVTPRRDDPAGLVGVFADTGAVGSRLGYTLSPFVSGVGYPDYAVFDATVLTEGDGGVLAAGWWDNNWGLSSPPLAGRDR